MPEWLRSWWSGLTDVQRTIIIVAVCLLALGVLASYVFLGTDYGGFGGWLQGWVQ